MNNDFSGQHHPAIPSAGLCLCGFADASGLGWCGNCGLLQSHDTSHDFLDAIADQNFHGIVLPCLLLGDIGLNSWYPSYALQTTSRDRESDFALVTATMQQNPLAENTSHRASGTCSSMHPKAQWSQNDPRLPGPIQKPQDVDPTREIEAQDLRLLEVDTSGKRSGWGYPIVSSGLSDFAGSYLDSNYFEGLLPHRKDHLITLGTYDHLAQDLRS
jgi:hypothetical protein